MNVFKTSFDSNTSRSHQAEEELNSESQASGLAISANYMSSIGQGPFFSPLLVVPWIPMPQRKNYDLSRMCVHRNSLL